VQPKEDLPARLLALHYQAIKKHFEGPVLFHFTKLGTRDRQRLMRKGVQFVVTNRILFAPELGRAGPIPTFKMDWDNRLDKKELSPLAETILIGQLLDERFEELPGKAIAEKLNITPAAASQALSDLERRGLAYLERQGKAKLTKFDDRAELWVKALGILSNPIESEIELHTAPKNAVKAGLTALAETTMLADTGPATFAAYKRNIKKTLDQHIKQHSTAKPNGDGCLLQLWRRDPEMLMKEGRVDPISLFLTLQDSTDERIQKELDNLLKNIGLKVE
jgi:DNA-binding transcriptional ArsR family regulator